MPNHAQLTFVREKADLGREACRERFLRVWSDEEDFAACWREIEKEHSSAWRYARTASRSRALVAGLLLAGILFLIGWYALREGGIPRGLWLILALVAAIFTHFVLRGRDRSGRDDS